MEHAQRGEVRHINPDTRPANPAFTNVVVVTGPVRTVYIGGQDAVNASGEIVGKGDIRQQVRQVFVNLEGALKAAGAGLEHVVKWNVYVVEGYSFEAGLRGIPGGLGQPSESAGDHRDVRLGAGKPRFSRGDGRDCRRPPGLRMRPRARDGVMIAIDCRHDLRRYDPRLDQRSIHRYRRGSSRTGRLEPCLPAPASRGGFRLDALSNVPVSERVIDPFQIRDDFHHIQRINSVHD